MNLGLNTEPAACFASVQTQIRDLMMLLRCERESGFHKEIKASAVSGRKALFGRSGRNSIFLRLLSAKKILRNIDRTAEFLPAAGFFSDSRSLSRRQDYIKHDLLYFIAATDCNEDTVGHSQFVAAYSLLLAKAAGIEDAQQLADIEHGALLHDIGKIGIPESVLRKPGSLTALEREIVGEHPLIGYEIIREFDFLKNAAQIVLSHHERIDGGGYPYGLAGREIPFEALIFSIADSIDAITSDRPYRKGRGFEEAFREIEKCSGSQFDPSLVRLVRSISKERWLQAKLATFSRLSFPTIH